MIVVFNQPFSQIAVEYLRIRVGIAQINEFFLESAVEPFVVGIVLRSSDSGIILFDLELLASSLEILLESRAIIMSDSRYFSFYLVEL